VLVLNADVDGTLETESLLPSDGVAMNGVVDGALKTSRNVDTFGNSRLLIYARVFMACDILLSRISIRVGKNIGF